MGLKNGKKRVVNPAPPVNGNVKYKLSLLDKIFGYKGAFINNAPVVKNVTRKIEANITTKVYQELRKADAGVKRTLHHAQASEKAGQGAYVLEFRTAGSGNNQWNKMSKGFNGHNESVELTELPVEKDPESKYYDEIVNNMKQKYHLDVEKDSDEVIAEKLTEEYGAPLYIDNQGTLQKNPAPNTSVLSGVRLKVDPQTNKTVAHLSGPMGSILWLGKGIRNSGEYNIENLKSYMLQLADAWLSEVRQQKLDTKDQKPIYLYMQGHSRGAVATSEGAAMIENLIRTKYQDLKDLVHINVRVFDPVPGTGSHTGHEAIDQKKENFTVYGNKNASGVMSGDGKDRNDFTVVYSIHSNHNVNFKPMAVTGAKRVILSPRDHDLGLYDVAETDSKLHKKGYINGENGEEYRGTGLHDLKEGLFLLDENNILVEVKNQQEAYRFLDSVYADRMDYWQRTRHLTMYAVVDDWFARHKDEITEKDTRYAPKEEIRKDLVRLRDYIDRRSELARPEKVKARLVASLFAHTNLYNKAEKDPLRLTREAFNRYKRLAGDDRLVFQIEDDPRFRQFIKGLTDEEIKDIIRDPSNNRLVKDFNAFIKTTVPESGQDLINKSLASAQTALKNTLSAEISEDGNRQLTDSGTAKRFIVANIIGNRLVDELAKKNKDAYKTETKEQYAKYIRSAESQVSGLVKNADFIRFYENMTPGELHQLAIGEASAADQMMARFRASREMPEKEKLLQDISLMKKQCDGVFPPDGSPQTSLRICAMLRKGMKLETAMDPDKLMEKKQEFENYDYGDADSAHRNTRTELCKSGVKNALDYVDKKMSSMKNVSLAELSKPENRDLYAVSRFLEELGRQMKTDAPAGADGNAYADAEINRLQARLTGFNALMKPVLDNAAKFAEAVNHPAGLNVGSSLSQMIDLKANMYLADTVLKQVQKKGLSFTETVKQGSKVCQAAAEKTPPIAPQQVELGKFLDIASSSAAAQTALLTEVLTNDKCLRNAAKKNNKDTIKLFRSEFDRIKKQLPGKAEAKESAACLA